jgi:hypothetical protein
MDGVAGGAGVSMGRRGAWVRGGGRCGGARQSPERDRMRALGVQESMDVSVRTG